MTGNTVSNSPERIDQISDITIADQALVPRLIAKRDEYLIRLVEAGALFQHPNAQLFTGNAFGALKLHVMDAVLSANEAAPGQPIPKADIVAYVTDKTGYNLTPFLETPSKFDEDSRIWGPDYQAINDRAGANPLTQIANHTMASAYWIVRTYASGSTQGIEGGTGLPEVPLQA